MKTRDCRECGEEFVTNGDGIFCVRCRQTFRKHFGRRVDAKTRSQSNPGQMGQIHW